MITLQRKFKIKGFPKVAEFNAMPFGRQIEWHKKIQEFKAKAKDTHISQKRITNAKAIREFIDLYNVDEYYCEFHDSPDYRDDTFQVWYMEKT